MPLSEYTLTLTPQDLQILYTGLGELKLKDAAPTFGKLQAQTLQQEQQHTSAAIPPA
jgi:hypothetical protein